MKDGPWRHAVKRVARACFDFDLAVSRAMLRLRGETPYRLGGDCGRCGSCCEAPAIQASKLVWHLPSLRRLYLAWQRSVNGFELVERDPRRRMFVFKCSHFDSRSRSCDSYDSRPGICRDYPRLQLYQSSPEFLPACGYRPVASNAIGLSAALDRIQLDTTTRAKLQDRLHLDE